MWDAVTLVLYSGCRQAPALAELTALYVGRTCSFWKEAAVMLWLEECVKEVLRRVDARDPAVEDCQNKSDVNELICCPCFWALHYVFIPLFQEKAEVPERTEEHPSSRSPFRDQRSCLKSASSAKLLATTHQHLIHSDIYSSKCKSVFRNGGCTVIYALLTNPDAYFTFWTTDWDPVGSSFGILMCKASADTVGLKRTYFSL